MQALFIFLYKSFSNVLAEPLRDTDGTLNLSGEAADEMAVDNEDTSEMELDKESDRSQKRCLLLPSNSLWSQYVIVLLLN